MNLNVHCIECGGILKDPSGIIQSSNHPEQYLHNQMCKWIISANESQQIQLTWLTFSLENQRTCNNDYVEIYDNSISANASKIARYFNFGIEVYSQDSKLN